MSSRIEVLSLKIRVGDQTIELSPDEFKALRDAAKVLLPEERSPFDPTSYMGTTAWKNVPLQWDVDDLRMSLANQQYRPTPPTTGVAQLPTIPMGNDYYDAPTLSTTASQP